MTISIKRSAQSFLVLCCGLSAGCGASPEGSSESDETPGTVSIALTQVPAAVQCIRVVATGSSTVTTNLSVAVNSSSASLSLGRLPLGVVQFSASAFDLACSAVGTASPTWVADNVSTTLRAGVPATVSLTFRTDNPVTVAANFVQSALELLPFRFGGDANGLVMADATLRTTGFPAGLTSSETFTNSGMTDVQSGAAGSDHLCVIRKSNGSVACVGSNAFGQLGPGVAIGAFTTTPTNVPLPFAKTRQLVAGRQFTCAMAEPAATNLSEIFCWGDNSRGQLGAVTTGTFSATPVQSGASISDSVYAGDQFACAISFGGVFCWGANSFGQLGNGTTTDSTVPVSVSGAVAPVSLALGGNHACSLGATGAVRCWGNNITGQLGNGTNTSSLVPVDVLGLGAGSNVVQLAAGTSSTFARFANGNVSVWGSNSSGELGLGDRTNRNTQTLLATVQDVAQIATSDFSTLVLLSSRTVLGWGTNNNFNLGDGTRGTRYVPTKLLTQ